MNCRHILGASLLLNAVLLAGGFWTGSRNAGLPAPDRLSEASKLSKAGVFQSAQSSTTPGFRKVPQQGPRPWSLVQSDDLAVYIRHLRAAGFSEPVVQNIIVRELEWLSETAADEAPEKQNFWQTGVEREALRKRQHHAERARKIGQHAKIKELLGVDWFETSAATMGESSLFGAYLGGDLDDSQAQRLNSVWAKVQDGKKELRRSGELKTPAIEAGRMQVYRETVDEWQRVMGAAKLEELELRGMAMNVTDVWGSERLFGSVMTGAELRELLRIKKEIDMPLGDLFGVDPPKPTPEKVQAINEQIRALLGEERFQGYQRAQDPQFRWIHGTFGGQDGSMDFSWAVFDIYAGLKEGAASVKNQLGLTDEQQRAALEELKTATEKALERSLGQERAAPFIGKGNSRLSWLDDLTVKDDGPK